MELSNKYVNSNNAERQTIRNSLTQQAFDNLWTFCTRATIFGLRDNSDTSYLANALNALAMIELKRCDHREVLFAVAFANHGIKKTGLNAEKLYKQAITIAEPKMAELLIGFESQEEEEKSLEMMAGYTEIQSTQGIGFVECGYHTYTPKINLVDIGLQIAVFIEAEKYQATSVSVAKDPPLSWVDNNELKNILKRTLGTASVNAYLKEELCKDWIWQNFHLYLTECKNQDDAQNIVDIANQSESKGFYKMVMSVDEVFCILITRSTALGVNTFEDAESIKRFRKPLEQLIKENLV